MSKVEHNSDTNPSSAEQLKAIVERIESLEEEKRQISADIREVYDEAMANGFDVRTLYKILQSRRKETRERHEEEALLRAYMRMLGME